MGFLNNNKHSLRLPLRALVCAALACLLLLTDPASFAQEPDNSIAPPEGISISSISLARDRANERETLNETQRATAKSFYDTAETALKSGQQASEGIVRLNLLIETAPKRLLELQAEIADLQELPPVTLDLDSNEMNSQRLADLQQSLISKEAEQRALRAQVTDLRTELEALQTRRLNAPKEQAEARTKISELTEQLAARGEAAQGPVDQAQTTALKSRLYFRRAQAAALEVEIASFAERQKLTVARRDLGQLQLSRLSDEIAALQRLTGQQKTIDARQFVTRAQTSLDAISQQGEGDGAASHPLVISYAQENLSLAQQVLGIAKEASRLPQRQAQKRSQIDILEADLTTAQSLIELGNLSRQSATTLRQLRSDNVSVSVVDAEIAALKQSIATATQNRLLAQNRIRDLGNGDADIAGTLKKWQNETQSEAELSDADIETLRLLHDQRRLILAEISSSARDRLESLNQLKSTLDILQTKSRNLTSLLDTNLLWLPSIAAIDFSWPGKVITGFAAVFSPRNLSLTAQTLKESANANLLLVLIFFIIAAGCFTLRERLWTDIERRAAMVGRVQQDSYLHTPAVALSCIIIALPLAVVFFLMGLLFELAPKQDLFIENLADTFFYLSIFTGFFLTWRTWDSDLSLFDKHFKLNAGMRHEINKQLRWFIPVTATSTAFVGLTVDSNDPNVFEGFSLAAFLVTVISLSFISYKILWKRRNASDLALRGSENSGKFLPAIAVLMIAVPLLCGLFASLGYYETASELLYRLFISGWLLITTYVVYGTTRRTVVVSKRRIALQQAIERRDIAIKARQEQKEAVDRGEDVAPPPAVNYEQIDIETVSRQTEKMLNAFMFVLFAVLMWMIWSDLLPALSFFDNIELGHYMVETVDTETGGMVTIERAITLWNIIQAFVIFGLTVMAARNLPGFLEIFALNRLGLDAGTRYAIVTILGYLIFGFGLFMGLDRLGLQWSQLKWVITGLSVGIGLGLQKIIANFVSGLIILFERPVRLGDYVTIGEGSGTVTRIQIRATTLVDLDNREILIPNEELISQRVTNWTLSNSITRLVINVGIAYGSDTDGAKEIILKVLRANTLVLDTPPPQVIFSGFGDSSLDFEVRAFLKCFEDRVPTRHALHTDINKALEAAGVTIPFPQRDLHIIAPPEALSPAAKTPSKAKPKKA